MICDYWDEVKYKSNPIFVIFISMAREMAK